MKGSNLPVISGPKFKLRDGPAEGCVNAKFEGGIINFAFYLPGDDIKEPAGGHASWVVVSRGRSRKTTKK